MALSGVAATGTLVTALGVATTGNPDYAGSSSALSLLFADDGPHSEIVRAALMAFGVLLVPMGVAAHRFQSGAKTSAVAGTLLVLTGFTTAMAATLRATSETGLAGISEGTWHAVAAAVAGGAGLGAVLSQTLGVRGQAAWRGFYRYSIALVTTASLSGALAALDLWPAMVGVYERVFLVGGVAWLVALSVKLWRTAPTPSGN